MNLPLHVEQPWAALLLALPVLLALGYALGYAGQRLRLPANLLQRGRARMPVVAQLPYLLGMLALVALILALMQPRLRTTRSGASAPGRDVLLVLDVSLSMQAPDMPPTRLEAARQWARTWIDQHPNDRIGIIVFAEEAYAYVPLTLDHAFLQTQLAALEPNTLPNEGTALGNAIGMALAHIPEAGAGRALLLLTDGAGNRGKLSPLLAADAAGRRNIPIHTVLLGRMAANQTTASQPDRQLLREVARRSGGLYQEAGDEQGLQALSQALEALPVAAQQAPPVQVALPLEYPLLALAGLLIVLAVALRQLGVWNPLEG